MPKVSPVDDPADPNKDHLQEGSKLQKVEESEAKRVTSEISAATASAQNEEKKDKPEIQKVKTDATIAIEVRADITDSNQLEQTDKVLATETKEKMLCGFPLSNVLISVFICLACFGVGIGIGAVIPGETAECPSTIAPPVPTPTLETTTLTTLLSTTEDTKPNNSYFYNAGEIGLLQGIMDRRICKECSDEKEHEIVKFLNIPYSEVKFFTDYMSICEVGQESKFKIKPMGPQNRFTAPIKRKLPLQDGYYNAMKFGLKCPTNIPSGWLDGYVSFMIITKVIYFYGLL